MAQGTYITSPKKKKVCKRLIILGILFTLIGTIALGTTNAADWAIGVFLIGCLLDGGCSFYIGKIKRGLLFTITGGLVFVGAIMDFLKVSTGKMTDYHGYPIIE